MRIVQVSCNLECGGSGAMVVGLSAALAELGHEVDVVCLDRPTGSDHERYSLTTLNRHGLQTQFLGRNAGSAGLSAGARLWRLLMTRDYDICHSHLPLPDAVTSVARHLTRRCVQHVLTVHNTREPRSRMIAACIRGVHVVYCSEAARRKNPTRGISSAVIPNGIRQIAYTQPSATRTETRSRLGLPDSAVVVIAVGRMCAQKNFESALQGFAHVARRDAGRELRLLLCGDGPDKKRLEQKLIDLDLVGTVTFLGNRTDMPDLLGASDMFLSTSLYEGMPIAVLEALAVGLPCALSSIEEHYEVGGSMPGCAFIESTHPKDIADALSSLIAQRNSRGFLLDARAPIMAKFSIDHCSRAYAALYRSVLPNSAVVRTQQASE